jgi:hypothetical protein
MSDAWRKEETHELSRLCSASHLFDDMLVVID